MRARGRSGSSRQRSSARRPAARSLQQLAPRRGRVRADRGLLRRLAQVREHVALGARMRGVVPEHVPVDGRGLHGLASALAVVDPDREGADLCPPPSGAPSPPSSRRSATSQRLPRTGGRRRCAPRRAAGAAIRAPDVASEVTDRRSCSEHDAVAARGQQLLERGLDRAGRNCVQNTYSTPRSTARSKPRASILVAGNSEPKHVARRAGTVRRTKSQAGRHPPLRCQTRAPVARSLTFRRWRRSPGP